MHGVDTGTLLRRGLMVFVALTVIKAIEYFLAITVSSGLLIPMIVIAVACTWVIAVYFMHIPQLWKPEE